MLDSLKFQQYAVRLHGLSPAAIEYLTTTRTSEPSRPVGVFARTNVVSADVSMKMGRTVAAESHTERTVALKFEWDPEVLEYWDQPPSIEILKVNKRGHRRRQQYTSDFLCLSINGPIVVEVKTIDEAESLVKTDPRNWVKTEDGYDYIPAREAYEQQYGLKFKVITVESADHLVAENIRILNAARTAEQYEPILGLRVNELLADQSVWRLDELKAELLQADYTSVIQMIDSGVLAFDMASASLAFPDQCYVASTPALLSNFNQNDPEDLLGEDADPISTTLMPTGRTAKRALERLRRIESGESSSSVRRWKKQILEGRKKGLNALQALVDADRNIMGRRSKLKKEVREFLNDFIENECLSMRTESLIQMYYEYCAQVKTAEYKHKPVSTQTFYNRVAQISPERVGEAKGGKRMSLAMAPPTDPKKRHIAPTLPWMKAGVDHYNVDISLVVYEDSETIYTARPWLTIMRDVATDKVLAFSISLEAPSRRSCAKLIRDCVRRHGKLPREILVDHGADLTSVYFRSLLAHYHVTHSLRPSGSARVGSDVERFFRQFIEEHLSQRPGFIAGIKNLRAIDRKKAPEKAAILTVEDLYTELSAYLIYQSEKPIGTAAQSSSVVYEDTLKRFPFIPIPVELDQEFILATSVDAGSYRVDQQRGIHVRDLHYSCPELQLLRGVKTRTDIRIDPENPYMIFVLIQGCWFPARNTKNYRYKAKSIEQKVAEGVLVYECSTFRRSIKMEKGIGYRDVLNQKDQELERRLEASEEFYRQEKPDVFQPVQRMQEDDVFIVRDLKTEDW
ncbi:hypothetical protein [Bacterioplanoides pacificum]|uniref:Integrase catalytic domain-containing protein n=1 Tax=Bacterioplanoides pacificum TaxID=1171596 RepID=A0ABV7VNJ4_9GAMM